MPPFNRALLVSAASLAAASSLQAQSPALGSPVSAAGSFVGEDSLDRAALFTQSAFAAPRGRFGFTVQALGESVTAESGGVKLQDRMGGAAFSTFYGLTDAVTLGAGLPYQSVTSEFSGGGLRSEENVDGFGDLELFGRLRAFRSATGATKLALGAGVTVPTGDDVFTAEDPTYQVGGAMSHRVNRVTFHVAPDVRFIEARDPSYDLNVAASFAASPKLALSVEGLSRFQGGISGTDAERTRLMDLGAGVRYNAVENLVLDLGLRANALNNIEDTNVSNGGMIFGFNWLF